MASPCSRVVIAALVIAALYCLGHAVFYLTEYFNAERTPWLFSGLYPHWVAVKHSGTTWLGWSLFLGVVAVLVKPASKIYRWYVVELVGAFFLGVFYLWQDAQDPLHQVGLGFVADALQSFVSTLAGTTTQYLVVEPLALVSLALVAVGSFEAGGLAKCVRAISAALVPLPVLVWVGDRPEFDLYFVTSISKTPLADVLTNRALLELAVAVFIASEALVLARSKPRLTPKHAGGEDG